jgi:hypothetical protein
LQEELSCLGYDAGSYGAYDKDGAEEAKSLTLREEQVGVCVYVTCITIIDTIILTNYTNDAYLIIHL